jgi:alkanesulfonate monooxygenase SsuD/methylene tetrahydromethanopterin reductase-like flavin-dependent oxidoreductase (luciferase family)
MKSAYFTHVWRRDGMTPAQRYERLWWQAETADRLGFDYLFSVEHHCTPRESWMTSPMAFGTAMALRTERIRFGPFGWVPPLRHPLHLVEDVATLDQISDGRLEVGIASGVSPDIFTPFGADFENRKALTTEACELLRVALAGDGPFDFDGQFHQLRGVELSFRAVQRPYPPVWIPTTDRALLRYLARIGGNSGSTMIVPRAATATVYRHFVEWHRAAHAGTVPQIGYWSLVHVAENDALAEARAEDEVRRCLVETLQYGSVSRSRPQAAPASGLSTADILDGAGDFRFLMDQNLIFVGSPSTVAERITAAAREGYFNVLLGEFSFGELSYDDEADSMRRYAHEVMPLLAGTDPFGVEPVAPPLAVAAGRADRPAPANEPVYDPQEQEQVAARLEALGYLG